ncbi:MAG TPA: YciI family protein [Microbacteriaceae bacterium]
MRYMLLLKATADTESGRMPTDQELTEMGQFNEKLVNAGVMLAGEGLHASADGARVDYSGDDRVVTDGPFTETKELIAGFWIIQAASKEEAVEWARRVPLTEGQIEVRQVFEDSEFDQSNEYVQKEKVWRQEQESRGK